jgi:plastocyanin
MKNRVFVFFTLCVGLAYGTIAHAAVLTVKTPFEGQAPAAEKIKADADPKCKLMHPDGIVPDQVIVNSNGTLKNVFVYVKEGLAGKKFEAPKEPVTFNQEGCQYNPKVFGIQVNQPLEIVNSDDTLHNVHALPTQSQSFNLGMPIKGMKLKKTFTKPEVMVKIKCEVHPWMSAYAGVVDNPFYGVTGDDGAATIKDLPPGEYTLEAWHEKYGTQTQKVTVTDKDQEISFSFKA